MTIAAAASGMNTSNFPHWSNQVWRRIQASIARETERIGIARKVLSRDEVGNTSLTVPENRFLFEKNAFSINEAPVTPLVEIWVDFGLSPQQVRDEASLGTARVLANHVAQFLTQAQDALVFQGDRALIQDVRFLERGVQLRSGPPGPGLLGLALPSQNFKVKAFEQGPLLYGDRTYAAVAAGYRALQAKGHDGPYAIVLPPKAYADAFSPIPQTQLMPATRIEALLNTALLGTGTLPESEGVLLSLGGASFELVIGREIKLVFLQENPDGTYRFRVQLRFALRVQDPGGIVKFTFQSASEEVGNGKSN